MLHSLGQKTFLELALLTCPASSFDIPCALPYLQSVSSNCSKLHAVPNIPRYLMFLCFIFCFISTFHLLSVPQDAAEVILISKWCQLTRPGLSALLYSHNALHIFLCWNSTCCSALLILIFAYPSRVNSL